MSGRNNRPPVPKRDAHHAGFHSARELPFSRAVELVPHPAWPEDMRVSQLRMGPVSFASHPPMLEVRVATQLQSLQELLEDNQMLAATHVALKLDVEAAHKDLQWMANYAESLRTKKDSQVERLYDRSCEMEPDLLDAEAMKTELVQVHADIEELAAARQELTSDVRMMTQDLTRMNGDLEQVAALKAEIESMRQELQHVRAATEYEKTRYAENYEHGQAMEKNMFSMAQELEKIREERANAEKRARAAAAAAGDLGVCHNANYGSAEVGYAGNPNPASYGMNPVQSGAETFFHYASGPAWNAYEMQEAQRHR